MPDCQRRFSNVKKVENQRESRRHPNRLRQRVCQRAAPRERSPSLRLLQILRRCRSADHEGNTGSPALKPERPVPVCPVLATLHRLTTRYPTWRYFILDEIFVMLRQECTTMTRDALLETLRSYWRDGQVLFRQGYGSQLQFALPRRKP